MVDLWQAKDKLTRRELALAALLRQKEDLLRKQGEVEAPGYLEKVARDQLGLARPGEEVVIIPDELLSLGAEVASGEAVPNWKKWARLLR